MNAADRHRKLSRTDAVTAWLLRVMPLVVAFAIGYACSSLVTVRH